MSADRSVPRSPAPARPESAQVETEIGFSPRLGPAAVHPEQTGRTFNEFLRSRSGLTAVRVLLAAFILLSWEAASTYLIDPFWLSQPTAVAAVLQGWITSGTLFVHLLTTLTAMILGFVIGAVAGVSAGVILGRAPFLASVLSPFLTALYSIPRIALAPLFVLWFGIGTLPKVVLVSFIVFFLTFRSTFTGVRSVDSDLVDVVRVMGAGRRQIMQKVVLPSSIAWIFSGLRIAAPYALVGAVVGEFVASASGIGYVIRSAAGVFDTAGVFAGLVVLMALGFWLDQLLQVIEARLSKWRVSEVV